MDKGLPDVAVAKLGPVERYGIRLVLLGAAVALVGIPFGILLHQVVKKGPLTALDEDAAGWLHERVEDHGAVVAGLQVISFLGKPIWLLIAVGVPAVWLLTRGKVHLVAFLACTAIGGGMVDTAVKVAVGRPRPELDQPVAAAFGHSFPSGHSMSSVVCYGALLLVFLPLLGDHRRKAVAAAVALVVAIGFSRLALGVHFVSDVLGGYVLGLAWLIASVAAFEIYREDRGLRPTQPLAEGVEPEEVKASA